MLTQLKVQGFKSLRDVALRLPRFCVLFGPNAAGKSNLVEAIRVLSWIGTERTLDDAIKGSLRGYPLEAFSMPVGGTAELVEQKEVHLSLEADLELPGPNGTTDNAYRYQIKVGINPRSGGLANRHECLAALSASGTPKGRPAIRPAIRPDGDRASIPRQTGGGRPREEPFGQRRIARSSSPPILPCSAARYSVKPGASPAGTWVSSACAVEDGTPRFTNSTSGRFSPIR